MGDNDPSKEVQYLTHMTGHGSYWNLRELGRQRGGKRKSFLSEMLVPGLWYGGSRDQ